MTAMRVQGTMTAAERKNLTVLADSETPTLDALSNQCPQKNQAGVTRA
jgi:hypothetical protein